MKTLNILLIEDNPADVRLIQEMLKEISHFTSNLISSLTLKEGCEQIQKNNPDIILLDLSLPDSTGQQTFQKVKDCSKETPIILITGNEDEELSLKLIKEGAQDYITKQSLHPVLFGKSILYSIERKQIEKALRESEERFRNYIEYAPDGIFIIDNTGRYLEANHAACRITGYSKEEIEQMSVSDMLCAESYKNGLAHFNKLMEMGAATSDLWHKHKEGSKRCLTINAVKLSDTQALNFVKDITVSKRAEQELIYANKELAFQNNEKEKRATELTIANKELIFQNAEKVKKADELVIANILKAEEEKYKYIIEEKNVTNQRGINNFSGYQQHFNVSQI